MNPHYDRYLVKKYEPLYRDRYADIRTTAMCWGFECGDGWFNIINGLSYYLCHDWLRAKEYYDLIKDRKGEPLFALDKVITQETINEAYEDVIEAYEKTPVAIQVKEKYGTLRFYISGGTDDHYSYINFAEYMSSVTCEVCGNKGKSNRNGWISTRCKEHEDF